MKAITCTKCESIFYANIGSWCKECTSLYKKAYYKANKLKISRQKSAYYSDNKNIIKKRVKRWYIANKHHKKEYDRLRTIQNKTKNSERNRKYYLLNKENIILKVKKNNKIKYKHNLAYRIKNRISCEVRRKLNKSRESVLKYLPYSISELKVHLENQFESWMNWNNWGTYKIDNWNDNDQSTWTWQIDHIIPQSETPYTSMSDENFIKSWGLRNLRPYSSKNNVLDGANRTRHK